MNRQTDKQTAPTHSPLQPLHKPPLDLATAHLTLDPPLPQAPVALPHPSTEKTHRHRHTHTHTNTYISHSPQTPTPTAATAQSNPPHSAPADPTHDARNPDRRAPLPPHPHPAPSYLLHFQSGLGRLRSLPVALAGEHDGRAVRPPGSHVAVYALRVGGGDD